jgi:indolepyruvate ferredoxin oxidoreductase alpha subunit
MSVISRAKKGEHLLLMGNGAIARGALEAGVKVVAGYPGTPSSEIVESLAGAATERDLYVEWSVNEKVALEVAAAASYSGLRSLCVMKQVGVNVAADFLLHLAEYGTRAGLVLVSCEDPGALSSTNEGDARPYSKMMEFALIEPADFQEAKDMTRWAFELSEEIHNIVMLRSVTRMSHASGNLVAGDLPEAAPVPRFECHGGFMDQATGPVLTFPPLVDPQRRRQMAGLKKAVTLFEDSPFNTYQGPFEPELLIITSSAAHMYCREALEILALENRVGMLKLGTTWPLPPKLLSKHIAASDQIFIVEEGTPFLEDNVKALCAETASRVGIKRFFGRRESVLPPVNELNPDLVIAGLARIMDFEYRTVDPAYRERVDLAMQQTPPRELTFCPGCPHRASYWLLNEALTLDNRQGFVCGDIGCYTLGAAECGFKTVKLSMAMGSGMGMASGFGKLGHFGFDQPAMAICGDSTFFHAVMPALVNAIHNQSDTILVVVDNSGTAMTGFQPHPGTPIGADQQALPALNIADICRAMGARVEISDPFDMAQTRGLLQDLMVDCGGVRVLILRQACALSPTKKGRKSFEMTVDPARCLAEQCGCNRLCTRVFKCPGLKIDQESQKTSIDEVICSGCGVCAAICPSGAIKTGKVA